MKHKMTGVYIHIPFCLRKCNYCDFLSFPAAEELHEKYVDALIAELRDFSREVDTVYIGGGTPTALPSFLLCKILEAVNRLALAPGAEITAEANPETLNREYLSEMRASGVNRLSMGLQATEAKHLRSLGRGHTFEDFEKNFYAARDAGFKNINIDLMFGLPDQSFEDWCYTLNVVKRLSPEHVSAYSLTPAEKTPLWDGIESGKIILPDETADRRMYHFTREFLCEPRYVHYELSNFAKPGLESRHNVNCWRMRPYIGFGLGAHSFDGQRRWHNTEDLDEYLRGGDIKKGIVELSDSDFNAEYMILGLRLTEGVRPREGYEDVIKRLAAEGMLTWKNERVALTSYGMDFANRVFGEFLNPF